MATNKRKVGEVHSANASREGNQRDDSKDVRGQIKESDKITLDRWQREVEDYDGNIALRAGRQVGKSTIIARKAGKFAALNKKQSIMIISATERQAYLLFSKVLTYLHDNYRTWIKKGKDRPTKTEIKLNNGSIIRCLPTGLDGLGIRGYTVDLLIADEAAFIPESVWPAITPMLATTGGKIILLSTPMGDKGYFHDRFFDKDFKTWHINAEDIAKQREEPQSSNMLAHQDREKARMSELQYAQEYLGEFVSDFRRLFSDRIIKKCCVLKRTQRIPDRDYYLGVDIARMGDDASTYEVIERLPQGRLAQRESQYTRKTLTTQTYDHILMMDAIWDFRKIGIDAGSGSLGVGIFDWLIKEPGIRHKIVAINNLKKSLDSRNEKYRRILKEDLYDNLIALMEKGKIQLLDDEELIECLRAIQYEYPREEGRKTMVKIFAAQHKFTDLVEGLTRAAWLANQKHINMSIYYF